MSKLLVTLRCWEILYICGALLRDTMSPRVSRPNNEMMYRYLHCYSYNQVNQPPIYPTNHNQIPFPFLFAMRRNRLQTDKRDGD